MDLAEVLDDLTFIPEMSVPSDANPNNTMSLVSTTNHLVLASSSSSPLWNE